jgi:hypothetical protein
MYLLYKILNSKHLFHYCFYFLVLLARIIFAVLVFTNPLLATFFSVFLDTFDADFACNQTFSQNTYELVDKAIDYFWYTLILVFVTINFPHLFLIFLSLFLLRTVGTIFFAYTQNRLYLFLFPNLFENIFILLVLGSYVNFLGFAIQGTYLYIFVAIAIILKLLQEWFLHVKKLSFRENLFKLPSRQWGNK